MISRTKRILNTIKTFDEYYHGYTEGNNSLRGYVCLMEELIELFLIGERILGEQKRKDYFRLYGLILRLRNILATFDEFRGIKKTFVVYD